MNKKLLASELVKVARVLTAAPTFQAARDAVLDYLKGEGWKVVGGLKIPHATSPDGEVRLWFKAQAVYYSKGSPHEFRMARSVHSDIRTMTPEKFVKDAMDYANS